MMIEKINIIEELTYQVPQHNYSLTPKQKKNTVDLFNKWLIWYWLYCPTTFHSIFLTFYHLHFRSYIIWIILTFDQMHFRSLSPPILFSFDLLYFQSLGFRSCNTKSELQEMSFKINTTIKGYSTFQKKKKKINI